MTAATETRPTPALTASATYSASLETLREHIAEMLHYRARAIHPRSHPRTHGVPSYCDECYESAVQAVEFMATWIVSGGGL